ncbi:hypothetical protein BZL29_1748 [Mycobacterium kansasii]|uniref:Uncharacterized protein n=1 Tax=Mycobacterium kansasii TaxID=1768 RepID=A0A1V3XPB0_MYCKA|nr:hypothetical protein BZL29_1748 [Mycobacterium kansasii]
MLTAHGSPDPRSAANARAVAGRLARLRPALTYGWRFVSRIRQAWSRCSANVRLTPSSLPAAVDQLLGRGGRRIASWFLAPGC